MVTVDLDAVTYPCVLTYRFTVGTTTRLAVAQVNHDGMVEFTGHALAQLYGQPPPEGPEALAAALEWRTVHELVTANGGELIEVAPW